MSGVSTVILGMLEDEAAGIQDAVTLAADLHDGAQLEDAITQACTQLSLAPTRELQEVIFQRIQLLHGMRTREQVERLEELRGLRK